MQFELRVLNGLHRGAALPLDGLVDTALEIGADGQAAMVLADPGIAGRHASLSMEGSGWLLEALEGDLVGVDDPRPQRLLELAPGGYARVGPVWMCISDADAAWQAPPEPTGLAETAPPPIVPADAEPAPRRTLRRVVLPMAALAVLAAATACAIAVRTPTATVAPPPLARPAALPRSVPVDAVAALTPAQLQSAFRHALDDAQLSDRIELALGEKRWVMRADLDADEQARFERLLKKFVLQHRFTLPLDAKIVGAAGMLPFEIVQVVTGNRAGIVTADGARLYVGDDYRGVRLVSVKDQHLVFAGKRKIEVNW